MVAATTAKSLPCEPSAPSKSQRSLSVQLTLGGCGGLVSLSQRHDVALGKAMEGQPWPITIGPRSSESQL